MQYTPHYQLPKFDSSDLVSAAVNQYNNGMNIIDTNLYSLSEESGTSTASETVSGQAVTWYWVKHNNGLLEMESSVVSLDVALSEETETTIFVQGTKSIQFMFPQTFKTVRIPEIELVQANMPVIFSGLQSTGGNYSVTGSSITGTLLFSSMLRKTATVGIRLKVKGTWK